MLSYMESWIPKLFAKNLEGTLCSALTPGIIFHREEGSGRVGKIDRKQKNLMRSQLEMILAQYREIEGQIENFQKPEDPEEYQRFWRELLEQNRQQIQSLSRYMVTRCNR